MAILNKTEQTQQPDALFAFTNGIIEDARLAPQEVSVQKAWLKGLAKLNLFSDREVDNLCASLDEAVSLIQNKTFKWDIRDEDIHMHLERFITDRHGELGKKMHMGRSRNDLIATTLRLFVHDLCQDAAAKTSLLVDALTHKAENTIDIILPGLTHLQHGQPVRLAHIFMSYAENFYRDEKRLVKAAEAALETCPLGAAALAGTPMKINLKEIAKELGFKAPCRNSYDAVGDRDFMLEALNALALLGVHLGRIAEDMIYAVSTPVAFLKLSPAWSTGSSIMPNKRNPDVPELTRGRAAHMIAAQTNGHMLVRTVPSSYGSDLHELKKVIIRSYDDALACLSVWPPFIQELEADEKRAEELLQKGHILATEVADALTSKGTAFREAYGTVKELVAEAERKECQVSDLPAEETGGIKLDFENAVEKRTGAGGTARANVLEDINVMKCRSKPKA